MSHRTWIIFLGLIFASPIPLFAQAAKSNSTTLFAAADKGDVAGIKRQLAAGVDVDARDGNGWTPLMNAAQAGQLEAVKVLLSAGANIENRSKAGETSLMAAALGGDVAVIKLLLSRGADASVISTQGLSAAELARRAKKLDAAQLLGGGAVRSPSTTKVTSASKLEGLIAEAAAAFKAGRYSEATTLFGEVVKIDTKHVLGWHFLGQSLANTGDIERARAAYARVLEIEPQGQLANRTRKLLEATLKDCVDCPEMVIVPAGSFQMGGIANNDEQPVHAVALKSFMMSKTEVTQKQWESVMGTNPSRYASCGGDCPVEQVSWNAAKEFISRLSAKTGKQYRLPSEAQWEYACRSGGAHEYCGGDNVDLLAWHGARDGGPRPVATKVPNAFGLYDMSGNVAEWVEDCWYENYSEMESGQSARTSENCTPRVVRGGSWADMSGSASSYLRATRRGRFYPEKGLYDIGFRVVKTVP